MGMSEAQLTPNVVDDAEGDMAEAAAAQMLPLLSKGLEHSFTQTTELNKWILASLVTLNGGAMIVLGDVADQLPTGDVANALAWFTGGCVVAVIAGILGTASVVASSKPIGEAMAFWTRVLRTGEMDAAENARIAKRLMRRSLLTYGTAALVGLGSLGCFAVGSFAISGHLQESSRASTTTSSQAERPRPVANSKAQPPAPR